MRKIITLFALCFLLAPFTSRAQQTASTLGTDFWMTFMRSDANNPSELSINISASEATHVKIENPTTGYVEERDIDAGGLETIGLLGTFERLVPTLDDEGNPVLDENGNPTYHPESYSADHMNDCYVGTNEDEKVSQRALHITSDKNISVFAANWRNKSFDVANVLPTNILRDEYVVACYRPEDHEDKYQGSHFAIIATEDNTIVDFAPTAKTQYWYSNAIMENPPYTVTTWDMGDTLTTPVLNTGDVFYVWSGEKHGLEADLTGTYVKARDGKKIAVFNGNPHTNIGLIDGEGARDRDHIFSQAYPTVYWGTKFPITGSQTTTGSIGGTPVNRKKDKIRVLALYDGTEVRVNGELVHTFNFNDNPRHFYEFELGQKGVVDKKDNVIQDPDIEVIEGTSCFVETSCPTAVHLYMVSNRYDFPIDPYCNGDPAMIWMNPIEQQIEDITFATYKSMDHFLNIVTLAGNTESVTLDGNDITAEGAVWETLAGNENYKFLRRKITDGTHNLKADAGFTAHVYGFKEKESYGYSAGGSAIPLDQSVTIDGKPVKAGEVTSICRDGEIPFSATLSIDPEIMRWDFGDGSPTVETKNGEIIYHEYSGAGTPRASLYLKFPDTDNCGGRSTLSDVTLYFDVTSGMPGVVAQRGNDFLVLRNYKVQEDGSQEDVTTVFNGAKFQWFRNDEEIPGATNAYLNEALDPNANYKVRITRADGTEVFSCPVKPDGDIAKTLSDLVSLNRNFVSGADGTEIIAEVAVPTAEAQLVSAQGVRMSSQTLTSGSNVLRVPNATGIYMLHVAAADGRKANFKIIVK